MSTIKEFENLEIWKTSRVLNIEIRALVLKLRCMNEYNLANQIERSSVSTMDNIAEGFGRGGNREFIQFLSIAKGSVSECKSQLYRCCDFGLIDEVTFHRILNQAEFIRRKIGALIEYLHNSQKKGIKYK